MCLNMFSILQIALCVSLIIVFISSFAHAFAVEPGTVIYRDGAKIVLFEVSSHGVGGLVYNQPSPIRLGDLCIPTFDMFADQHIMMGRDNNDVGTPTTNVPVTEMAPWFWLHNVAELADSSTLLQGADGLLYMGGNIEQASDLVRRGKIKASSFKFFHKYTTWQDLSLELEIQNGMAKYEGAATPSDVLRPYSLSFTLDDRSV
mmetsp:Transcript_12217/g.18744  ORF Transcript_12217/g.18744 Transcript_12217/m.18744 type:complete len:203 (-) Transcript_12217:109-717(-)